MTWKPEDEYPVFSKKEKDFIDRLIELIKDDKELHDAAVRLINGMAAEKEAKAEQLRKKLHGR